MNPAGTWLFSKSITRRHTVTQRICTCVCISFSYIWSMICMHFTHKTASPLVLVAQTIRYINSLTERYGRGPAYHHSLSSMSTSWSSKFDESAVWFRSYGLFKQIDSCRSEVWQHSNMSFNKLSTRLKPHTRIFFIISDVLHPFQII